MRVRWCACAWALLISWALAPAPVALAQLAPFVRPSGRAAREELSHPEAPVRLAAARTLGAHGPVRRAVTALVGALRSERDAAVRREILLALARRGDDAAVPVLVEALLAPGTADRPLVAQVLGAFPTEASMRALVAALEQDEPREAARRALVRIGPPAVPHLVLALRSLPAAPPAAEALAEIGDERAVPALVALSSQSTPARDAALRALGAMRAERAGPTVARLSRSSEPSTMLAALAVLGEVGGPAHVPLLEDRIARGEPDVRRVALRSLVRLDPRAAIPHLERAVSGATPDLAPTALDLAVTLRDPLASPVLHGMLVEGSRADAAASALAELEGGAGLGVLVHVAATSEAHRDAVTRALAIAVRKWSDVASSSLLERALRVLRGFSGARGLLLRAFARDPSVRAPLEAALGSDDAAARATAALALEVLGAAESERALAAALAREVDAEAFRREASALASAGAGCDLSALLVRFDDPEVAPEAMALAAETASTRGRPSRRRLGAVLRRALRSDDVRVRVGGALALARSLDRSSWRALAVALEDPNEEVRHAAARALASLGAVEALDAIAVRTRVEEGSLVLSALADAERDIRGRGFPRRGLVGREALRVVVRTAGAASTGRIPVDVVLPDARFLRFRTLETGELLLPDLPAGIADVRARVGAEPAPRPSRREH